jgi:hypothetical protein
MSAPEGWSQLVGATLYLEIEALPFLTDSVEKSKIVVKVDFSTFLLLQGSMAPLPRPVVVFERSDVVPHIDARETHRWP